MTKRSKRLRNRPRSRRKRRKEITQSQQEATDLYRKVKCKSTYSNYGLHAQIMVSPQLRNFAPACSPTSSNIPRIRVEKFTCHLISSSSGDTTIKLSIRVVGIRFSFHSDLTLTQRHLRLKRCSVIICKREILPRQ